MTVAPLILFVMHIAIGFTNDFRLFYLNTDKNNYSNLIIMYFIEMLIITKVRPD